MTSIFEQLLSIKSICNANFASFSSLEKSLFSAIERNGLDYSSNILHTARTSPWTFPTEKIYEQFSVNSNELANELTSGRIDAIMEAVKKAATNISVSGRGQT